MDHPPSFNATIIDNSEPRAPCVLLLDISSSMSGERIERLAAGLDLYRSALAADRIAAKRVEVAVVAFGGEVQTLWEFTTAEEFRRPQLIAGGDTPLGDAIHRGIDLVQDRKQLYWSNHVTFYRPWVFLISASPPTDLWRSAADRVRQGEATKSFSFFTVGMEGADFDALRRMTTRPPLRLKGLRFVELFQWLAESQRAVSQSVPGERVMLRNPATPDGWVAADPGEASHKEPQG